MSEAAPNLPVLVEERPSDLDKLKRLLLAGVASENSPRAYARALTNFLSWYRQQARGPFSKLVVEEYGTELARQGLSPLP